MRPGETLFEMAQRHVREGEAHVLKQRAIIDRLHRIDVDTSAAEALLAEFEHTLEDHRASVARMVEELRQGRRNEAGDLISRDALGPAPRPAPGGEDAQ
jgi:hypothetical protein